MARKVVEDWSASGMPIDLGKEWTDRLDRVEALAVSKKISAEDRSHLAAFPEIVVLTHLILNPPTTALDPKELYLATTAELSRRFARIYTTLGTQDPLYRHLCQPPAPRPGSIPQPDQAVESSGRRIGT
ncbi:hypothetical protein [Streptomyces sp. NBC_00154]|uniref:hypothetical protein n=1 Tax=Streptomyces sp. NBC_00154 TaxID=2975670 RepID=UPI002253CB8C|nr:hypothetical protein [Streptomyces sp. NBC_00154]MCX5315802.1 hypothetical protein [Streptomyces sp. NBC_00154]